MEYWNDGKMGLKAVKLFGRLFYSPLFQTAGQHQPDAGLVGDQYPPGPRGHHPGSKGGLQFRAGSEGPKASPGRFPLADQVEGRHESGADTRSTLGGKGRSGGGSLNRHPLQVASCRSQVKSFL
jgi:hypothetical protein